MKQLLITLFALMLSLGASAQKSMNIGKLFKGGLHGGDKVSETIIKGSKVEEYGLYTYHSLSTQETKHAERMEEAVLADAKSARAKEVQFIGNRLYYGFYIFGPNIGYDNRYIFYLNKTLKGGKDIILIYMDGPATPQQVKKMMKK